MGNWEFNSLKFFSTCLHALCANRGPVGHIGHLGHVDHSAKLKLYRYLCDEKKGYILSKQLLRSGTSIGANIREALRGQSKADFYAKLNISLKEASETEYWLELLHESSYIDEKSFNSIYSDCQEIMKLLVSITKTQPKP